MLRKNGAFVVIFKDSMQDQVFLVYRPDMRIWNLPGGGIENNETPEVAATRETLEETGLEVKLSNLAGTYKNVDSKTGEVWNLTTLFIGEVMSGSFKPEFPGNKGEWFPVDHLPKEVQPITNIRVQDALEYSGVPFAKEFRPKK